MCRLDWFRLVSLCILVSNVSVGYMLGGGSYKMVDCWNFGGDIKI